MPRSESEYADVEEELVRLFKQLQAELPPEAASLSIKRTKRNGVIVTLNSKNPAAASISAHAENGLALVDFSFGDYGPTWELPIEGQNPRACKQEVLQEVQEMSKAVMAGNCEHKRGFLSVTGIVQVLGHSYKITNMLEFHPKPRLHGTRTYESYVSEK